MLEPFHEDDEPCTAECKDDPDHCPANTRRPRRFTPRQTGTNHGRQ